MNIELLTRSDLEKLKIDIIQEITALIQPKNVNNEWLKSCEVKAILKCSSGTLQNLRINGILPFSKIGGTIYYNRGNVIALLKHR